MTYIPIAQLKRKGGYIPIAQLRETPQTPQDFSDIRLGGTDVFGVAQTTPITSEIKTLDLVKAAGQGIARQWAATGAKILAQATPEKNDVIDPKTFFGESPNARALGVSIFGKTESFNATDEDVDIMKTFGVDEEATRKFGGSLTILLSTLDVLGAEPFKGVVGLVRALKVADNAIDVAKALRTVGFADDVIEAYKDVFVPLTKTKEVKTVLDAALALQSKTTGKGYRPVSEFAKEVVPKVVPDISEPLAQEARKYKSAEEFVGAKTLTKDEMIELGAGGSLSKAYETEIPISKIDGREPIPVSATGGRYKKGREIKQPIEVQYNPDTDTYILYAGNHRVRQAEINGQKTIKAFVEDDSGKTKSQLTDFYNQAVKGVKELSTPEGLPKIFKTAKPPIESPTLAQIKQLGEDVKTLEGKSKEEIKAHISEWQEQLSSMEEIIEDMPGRKLTRFISRKEGEFLGFKDPNFAKTPSERQRIIEQNKKVYRASETAFETTSQADRFDNPDIIQEAIAKYQKAKADIANIKARIGELTKERVTISKGEVAAGVGMQQRRIQYRAVQERWELSDNEMKKFLHGRNISAMETDEWRTLLKEVDTFGEQTQKHTEAMIQLNAALEHKDLKKWDNLRAALDLPPIHQMNTEQLVNFEKILEQYKTGDEFFPVRMLKTLSNTELAGIKTTREVLEVLSKRSGRAVENMPIKSTEWHRTLGDRRLARQHPFLEFMVERKNRSLIEAEARTIELTDELDGLIKKARVSKERGVIERAIPTDENIIHWAETADEGTKATLEKTMTKEELAVAKRWDEIRKSYYDYLVKKHAEQKFSRFEGQYFPHIRRGFLETWKDDGVVKAFLEMRDRYRQDAFTMNILNEQTQEILPYEKWIGFAQFRSGNLIPTQNAAKAFEAYITALEKAKHLDEMTPEIMAYVHSLSARNFSQYGIELDTSLKKFTKEYINANKGRVPKGFFNPGGGFDVGNRSLMALTRMIDLGWNFSTQIAAPIGENLMTLTMLKPQAYTLAQKRAFTTQGRVIAEKYKNFIGRTTWEEMTRAANDIGDKFMAGAFAIYRQTTRSTNKLFLLGKITDDEFKTGVISSQRLAQLQIEMSKYRQVRGMESILGRTTEAQAVKQYKAWAIPPLTATIENATELSKLIRQDGIKALASDAGKELFYSIGIGSAIGLLIYSKYKELQEKKGGRTFIEDVVYKAMRDAVTIFGAFDPTMWTGIRVADFLEDLAKATLDLIMLEEYKTTGELKAPKEFQRALTPAIIRRLALEEEKKAPSGGKSMNTILKEMGLPPLPELTELPALPKLPALTP